MGDVKKRNKTQPKMALPDVKQTHTCHQTHDDCEYCDSMCLAMVEVLVNSRAILSQLRASDDDAEFDIPARRQ